MEEDSPARKIRQCGRTHSRHPQIFEAVTWMICLVNETAFILELENVTRENESAYRADALVDTIIFKRQPSDALFTSISV